MGRYKSRGQKAQDGLITRYMKLRRAMVEVRKLVGLGDKAKLEEIVEAVRELVENKEK